MDLGARSIRSAGAGSGSIEVTLPAALRDLQGLSCRISLRDGLRPEIVLMPDLRPARAAFARLWSLLAEACGGPAEELPLGELGLVLLPPPVSRPALAWVDGLVLVAPPPHPPEPLARCLRVMAPRLATRLEIADALAAGFGAAVAHAATGLILEPEDQEACDIAAAALATEGERPGGLRLDDAFAEKAWRGLAPRLARLVALHQDWTDDPARHAALAAAWRRGVALELSGD